MKPAPPSAASRSSRPRDDDTPKVEESVAAHAKRALRARVLGKITARLDAAIAALQQLRQRAGGPAEAPPEEDPRDSRLERPRDRRSTTEPIIEPPPVAPPRRGRALAIYVGLLLTGGAGGGLFAYSHFQQQLDRQLAASLRAEAALAKKTGPDASTLKRFDDERARRDQATQKFASAFAEFSASSNASTSVLENLLAQQFTENRRLQTALAENVQADAIAREALKKEQAAKVEAESRLAAALADQAEAKAVQRQLEATEKKLSALLGGAPPGNIDQNARARRASAERPGATKTGTCTLNTQNVDELKACLNDFNR